MTHAQRDRGIACCCADADADADADASFVIVTGRRRCRIRTAHRCDMGHHCNPCVSACLRVCDTLPAKVPLRAARDRSWH
jgi:hypothetical protein